MATIVALAQGEGATGMKPIMKMGGVRVARARRSARVTRWEKRALECEGGREWVWLAADRASGWRLAAGG